MGWQTPASRITIVFYHLCPSSELVTPAADSDGQLSGNHVAWTNERTSSWARCIHTRVIEIFFATHVGDFIWASGPRAKHIMHSGLRMSRCFAFAESRSRMLVTAPIVVTCELTSAEAGNDTPCTKSQQAAGRSSHRGREAPIHERDGKCHVDRAELSSGHFMWRQQVAERSPFSGGFRHHLVQKDSEIPSRKADNWAHLQECRGMGWRGGRGRRAT